MQTTSCMSFVDGFHFANSRLSQLPTLQAAQVTFTEPDSTISAFEASSATLLKVYFQKSCW